MQSRFKKFKPFKSFKMVSGLFYGLNYLNVLNCLNENFFGPLWLIHKNPARLEHRRREAAAVFH